MKRIVVFFIAMAFFVFMMPVNAFASKDSCGATIEEVSIDEQEKLQEISNKKINFANSMNQKYASDCENGLIVPVEEETKQLLIEKYSFATTIADKEKYSKYKLFFFNFTHT